MVCLAFAFLTQRRKKELADRAQHVVLASVSFDQDGKILVTQEGLLPCQKITKQYNQRSFNDEFNVSHPVFQWLFRITYNWSGVIDLVPPMRHHLRNIGMVKDPNRSMTPGSGSALEDDEISEDYSILFREHFCVAASELADDLGIPLSDLGVLYSGIMMTGSLAPEFQPKRKRSFKGRNRDDVEAGIINQTMFGRGQLLFLVRRVDKNEAQKFITEGYRFAYVQQVGDIIARSMQVPHSEILITIDRLHKYCNRVEENALSASSYLACFALRAAVKTSNGGWDILAPKEDPARLPMVELSADPLKPWQIKMINGLDSLSVNQCLSFLNNKAAEAVITQEKEFLESLLDQISALAVEVPEPFFGQALFCSKPVKAPGIGESSITGGDAATTTGGISIYAFCIIPDVHASSIKSTHKLTYVPLSFFRCSQRVYPNSPDHAILARKIHREFGAILSNIQMGNTTGQPPSHKDSLDKGSSVVSVSAPRRCHKSKRPSMKWSFSIPNLSRKGHLNLPSSNIKNDASSENGLVEHPSFSDHKFSDSSTAAMLSAHAFGGIMVSSDTTVEVQAKEDLANGGTTTIEMMGIKTEAGQGAKEEPTYVDELFRIASSRWQRA